MTYPEAIHFLLDLQKFGIKLSLDNIRQLLEYLDNPHLKLRVIHIAGTNGKGSTAAIIESLLCKANLKTGLYTSPHLVDIRERIRICGAKISPEEFTQYVERLQPCVTAIKATFFETITAIAFLHFFTESVDIAIIETGLGGRFDSTNVVEPIMTVITNIGYDHIDRLGNSLESIAFEKAGILKEGIPCITGCTQFEVLEILRKLTSEKNARLYQTADISISQTNASRAGSYFDLTTPKIHYPNLFLNLIGDHQRENAKIAVVACEMLEGVEVTQKEIERGLATVKWDGRLQLFSHQPKILLDVAHNIQGMQTFKSAIEKYFPDEKPIIVMGVMKDKAIEEMIETISPISDRFIAVSPDYHRSLPVDSLAHIAGKYFKNVERENSVENGMDRALKIARENNLVALIGSHFTIGEWLQKKSKK